MYEGGMRTPLWLFFYENRLETGTRTLDGFSFWNTRGG